jgi:hypothetical protein
MLCRGLLSVMAPPAAFARGQMSANLAANMCAHHSTAAQAASSCCCQQQHTACLLCYHSSRRSACLIAHATTNANPSQTCCCCWVVKSSRRLLSVVLTPVTTYCIVEPLLWDQEAPHTSSATTLLWDQEAPHTSSATTPAVTGSVSPHATNVRWHASSLCSAAAGSWGSSRHTLGCGRSCRPAMLTVATARVTCSAACAAKETVRVQL